MLSRAAGQCADQRAISFNMDPPDAAAADKNRLSLVEGEGTVFRDEGATAVETEYRPRADVVPHAPDQLLAPRFRSSRSSAVARRSPRPSSAVRTPFRG